jgi:CopA family copper-resistance protein
MNGTAPAGNWSGLFTPGERVRLRFINGSAMSIFDVRIPGLRMRVVAADGQQVRPVEIDEFRLTPAETLDVIVEPVADAYTIFAQSKDRAGYACGTLAARAGLAAPVPALDAVAYLSMADMGHGAQESPVAAGHEHDHAAAEHDHGTSAGGHPASERRNPGVDMQTAALAPRLDDPGVGLRDNGRRVLTYADLESAFADPDGREPGRTIELHLTGHMARFVWSFDGLRFSEAQPIDLSLGERVRLVLVNDTMMEHPIHLHGMWSDLEDEQGRFRVRKHTIAIPPGTRRSVRVTADAPGAWAFHCHLLFHMEAGMFRVVRVSDGPTTTQEHAPGAAGGAHAGGEHAR